MKSWLKWFILVLVLALLAAGALRLISTRQAQKAELAAQQSAAQVPAVLELAAADVLRVQTLELVQSLAIAGPLRASNSAFVKARVAGELQGLVLREGDRVSAGQVVARIDATESQARVRQAQQQAEAARAQVDIARRSFDNNRSLVDQGFISKTALDTSAASLAAAEASFRAAQAGADLANKSLEDTVLRAPMAGVVAQRLAQPGERLAVDTRILEIVDLSRLELEASLSPADSLLVQPGQEAVLSIEGASQTLSAKVLRVNPSAVAGSRAVLAYLAVQSNPGLRQGLFAQGRLSIGKLQVLAIPLAAVRTDKPLPYVLLIQDGAVVHQTVELGARGEQADQTMVGIKGLPERAVILSGTLGSQRAGTRVKLPVGQ
ncbi:MAG: efflux RND transporter periplasmic adaptor subunit [Burkholderiales bacterium]|nr:efflux RND transporter periplasmic adaptor subunit [Burkholderiales bacterium]